MKTLLLAVLLTTAASAQPAIAWGEWTCDGSVRVLPVYISANVLIATGIPGTANAPDTIQILLETSDSSTDAYLLSGSIAVNGEIRPLWLYAWRNHTSPADIAYFTVPAGSAVTAFTLTVTELHATQTHQMNITR